MSRRAVFVTVAVIGLGALVPAAARAQLTAAIGVEATISSTLLSVGQVNDLRFGNVVPGTPVSINPRTNPNAGGWVIHGSRNAELAINLTLPTQLSTGFWTMPISFAANSGCWRRQPGQAGCTFWNPATPLVRRIRNQNAPNNHFYVWIGGTVSPGAAQHTGVYTGTINMTVAYTGN